MSAITLHLGRRFEGEELHLHLPATPDKIEEQLTCLDDYAEDPGKPVELRDVGCEVVGIRQYLRQADLSREGELDRLNALAEKIEGMDWQQRDLLWGALDCESIGSLDKVLDVADHLDQYELFKDIRCDRDLGAHLVEAGWKDFPEHVLPYLNYAAIGLEYRSEHGGSFNGGGYVRKKDDGLQMEAGSKDPILTVRLYAPETKTPCSLDLPAPDGMLEQAMRTMGISDLAEADIHGIEDHICLLNCADPMDWSNVETLNELARLIDSWLDAGQDWTKFKAVCEAVQPDTWQEMLASYEETARELEEHWQTIRGQAQEAAGPEMGGMTFG